MLVDRRPDGGAATVVVTPEATSLSSVQLEAVELHDPVFSGGVTVPLGNR